MSLNNADLRNATLLGARLKVGTSLDGVTWGNTTCADAAASDGSVIRVEFYADNTLLVHDVTAPYSFDWTTTAAGAFVITTRAYDNDGAAATSQPVTVNVLPSADNAPPTVAITSPKNNATVYRLFGTTINANASDPDGTITKVEFYAGSSLLNTGTSAPYSFFWKPASRGNFTLTARAYDGDGAVTTSAPVTVRVK